MSQYNAVSTAACAQLEQLAFQICEGDAGDATQLLAATLGMLVARVADQRQGSTEHVLLGTAAIMVSTGLKVRAALMPDSPTYPAVLDSVMQTSQQTDQIQKLTNELLELFMAKLPDTREGLIQALAAAANLTGTFSTVVADREGWRLSSSLMLEVIDALMVAHKKTAEPVGLKHPAPMKTAGVQVVVPPDVTH